MQMKYNETAKKNGVYVISGCGWDSIPCDLGVNWVKQHFEGTVSHAETFAHVKSGEAVILRFYNFKNIFCCSKKKFLKLKL